ncbi:MAG: chromosomal replication initiator protein DnaA [Chloroflexi bacterium]|nr:chromosomal replication initiator protein DnaA [Chloroflexota bacterium]
MDAQSLWQAALGQLELQLPKANYDTWVRASGALSYEDGVLVVGVRSAYAKDWLENRLYGLIQRTVTKIAERTVTVRFVVRQNGAAVAEPVELLALDATAVQPPLEANDRDSARVNPRLTFDTFIVGQSNRLAHAGSLAVAEKPGATYNPLFIYGGVGLGKTHLLHAIGNYALASHKRTLYVSAETFANEMINSIRTRTTEEFRARYRTIDVLLLDDVQFIVNKEATQEELFHTFNDLHRENRQIVLCCDRSPKAFTGMEERLRSRFEWGLIADVQPPDVETRMVILQVKAEQKGVDLPREVTEFIAEQVDSNIRELEGALTRFLALARMMEYPLNVQTAERALSDLARPAAHVTIDDILQAVVVYYGVPCEDVVGPRRTRDLVVARQMAMYLARELTQMSHPQIAEALGGRDHTTVMHGCNKVAALFEKDDATRRQVLEIKSRLTGGGQRVPAQRTAHKVRV